MPALHSHLPAPLCIATPPPPPKQALQVCALPPCVPAAGTWCSTAASTSPACRRTSPSRWGSRGGPRRGRATPAAAAAAEQQRRTSSAATTLSSSRSPHYNLLLITSTPQSADDALLLQGGRAAEGQDSAQGGVPPAKVAAALLPCQQRFGATPPGGRLWPHAPTRALTTLKGHVYFFRVVCARRSPSPLCWMLACAHALTPPHALCAGHLPHRV